MLLPRGCLRGMLLPLLLLPLLPLLPLPPLPLSLRRCQPRLRPRRLPRCLPKLQRPSRNPQPLQLPLLPPPNLQQRQLLLPQNLKRHPVLRHLLKLLLYRHTRSGLSRAIGYTRPFKHPVTVPVFSL